MNPRDELISKVMTLTDDEANQVIALAIMAGILKGKENGQA